MDKVIKGIQEILLDNNSSSLADLLEDARHEVLSSSTYGQGLHSPVSTLIIFSTVSKTDQLNKISDTDKQTILNAALNFYPYKDNSPEIRELIFQVDINEIENLGKENVPENKIIFYVEKNPSGYSAYFDSHSNPNSYPAFVLVYNAGWNDFGRRNSFDLFFHNDPLSIIHFGSVRISDFLDQETVEVLPNKFYYLKDNFCSLGASFEFYTTLKSHFPDSYVSILLALKDAAFDYEALEKFEDTEQFISSIIRYETQQRILRDIKFVLNNFDLNNRYRFTYKFKPVFSEIETPFQFNFNNSSEVPNRVYAIIGRNGIGKTQFITSLPIDLSKEDSDGLFSPRKPIFSKVIAVSYSIFDKFTIPKSSASFNYVYCGLRTKKGDDYTDAGLARRFTLTCKRIQQIKRTEKWRKVLLNFIREDILSEFVEEVEDQDIKYEINSTAFAKAKDKLSSGESVILYVLTEIVANIRFDSLLLFDEPETHLHPNAISELTNTILEIVQDFQSYCIITTHSPLIIRELLSRSVFVLNRENDLLSINNIGIESFGENIGTLTEEVFGNKDIPKHYKKVLENLVKSGKTYDEIITLLQFDRHQIGLSAKLYLQNLINYKVQ